MQSLKEAVLEAVLDCDGNLDNMNLDKVLMHARNFLTQSFISESNGDEEAEIESIRQRMNEARSNMTNQS